MSKHLLPPERNRNANSTHRLSRLEIQKAINDLKRFVEARLETDLNLVKVRFGQKNGQFPVFFDCS